MNTFRRPMFRGGKVDSRGTGITSGLSYGGRVGLQGGGMPPTGSTFNINMGGRTPIPTGSNIFRPPAVIQSTPTGMSLLDRARNIPYLGRLIPAAGGRLAAATPFGLAALGGYGIGKTADFITRATDTPEAYAFRKEATRANPFLFDETSTDEFIEFSEKLREKDQGEKLGFFPRGGPEKRLEEMGLADQFTPEGDRIELPEVLEKLTENNENNQDRPGDGKAGNKETTTDIKDAIREDKELFAELLGAKKAKGQDISDMLLSFSSKALAPDATVKSAFAEFAADEVKRPSRVRKVDDSAAALAINAYIAGEKSKADLDRALKATEGKLDLEQDLLKRRSLTSRINQDRTGRTVKQIVVGNTKEWMSDNNLSGVPNLVSKKDIEDPKLLVQENVGEVFINEDTKEVFLMIQDANGKISLKQYY